MQINCNSHIILCDWGDTCDPLDGDEGKPLYCMLLQENKFKSINGTCMLMTHPGGKKVPYPVGYHMNSPQLSLEV